MAKLGILLVAVLCVIKLNISGILAKKDENLKLMPSEEVVARLHGTRIVWAMYPTAIESCRIKLHNEWYQCDPPKANSTFVFNQICEQHIPPIVSWTTNFEEGVCGAVLKYVRDDYNGFITFEILHKNVSHTNKMRFIVAREPTSSLKAFPDIRFNDYSHIKADCYVRRGRPAPNITWFLDDKQIKDGLEPAIATYNMKTDLYAIRQTLHLKFSWELLGSNLTCQVNYTYPDNDDNVITQQQEVSSIINIDFPPRPMYGNSTITRLYNIQKGSSARLNVSVCSKPNIDNAIWTVDGVPLTFFGGDMRPEVTPIDLGQQHVENARYKCSCNSLELFVNMNAKLMRSAYSLTVWNALGKAEFHIFIDDKKSTETTTQYSDVTSLTSLSPPAEKPAQNINTIIINTSQQNTEQELDKIHAREGTPALTLAAYVTVPLLLLIIFLGLLYYFYEKRIPTGLLQNNSACPPEEAVYAYVPIETVSFYSARALVAANRKVPTHVSFQPAVPERDHASDYDYATIIH